MSSIYINNYNREPSLFVSFQGKSEHRVSYKAAVTLEQVDLQLKDTRST